MTISTSPRPQRQLCPPSQRFWGSGGTGPSPGGSGGRVLAASTQTCRGAPHTWCPSPPAKRPGTCREEPGGCFPARTALLPRFTASPGRLLLAPLGGADIPGDSAAPGPGTRAEGFPIETHSKTYGRPPVGTGGTLATRRGLGLWGHTASGSWRLVRLPTPSRHTDVTQARAGAQRPPWLAGKERPHLFQLRGPGVPGLAAASLQRQCPHVHLDTTHDPLLLLCLLRSLTSILVVGFPPVVNPR